MNNELDFEDRLDVGMRWVRQPLHLWWLTQVRDYRIVTTRRVPRHSFLGTIRYERRWLVKRTSGSDGES